MKPEEITTLDFSREVPCAKYAAENNVQQQLGHVLEEFNEIYDALLYYTTHPEIPEHERMDKINEEITDAKTSLRTLQAIFGFSETEVEAMQITVNMKNKNRGYWEEKK